MSVSKASLLSSADRFSLSLVELSESFSTYSLLHTLSNPDMHTSPAHCSYTHHGFWRSLAFAEVIVSCRMVPSSTASGFAVNCLSRLMLLLAAIAFNLYSTHLYTHLERNSYRTILDITYSSANMSYLGSKMHRSHSVMIVAERSTASWHASAPSPNLRAPSCRSDHSM
jgi:hypothetical protein